MFLNKRYYSTKRKFKCNNDSNKEGKINLITIFNLIDIRKLYLIKKDIIKKYSLIIFSTLAVLFIGSLYTIMIKDEFSLSVYYST